MLVVEIIGLLTVKKKKEKLGHFILKNLYFSLYIRKIMINVKMFRSYFEKFCNFLYNVITFYQIT